MPEVWTIPRTWVSGEILTKALLDEQIRDNLSFLKVNIALEAADALGIVGGIITKTQSHHDLSAEVGVTDNLDTISGGNEGDVIYLRAASGHTITLKHGVDNIYSSNLADVDITDSIYAMLICDGTNWIVFAGGLSAADIQALIDASIAVHAALTNTHGCTTIADVSDIAIDANLSAAAQDAIAKKHTQGTDTALGTLNIKNPPIDADLIVLRDSTAAWALFTSTLTQFKAYLKTYFDTLYGSGGGEPVQGFRKIWIPDGYKLQVETTTGELAIRNIIDPEGEPSFNIVQGFRVESGILSVWI